MKTSTLLLILMLLNSCAIQHNGVTKQFSGTIDSIHGKGRFKTLYFDSWKLCGYYGNAKPKDSVTIFYETDKWGQNNFVN